MDWQPIETAPKDGTVILGCEEPSTAFGAPARMPCKWGEAEDGIVCWCLAWGCWWDETNAFEPMWWQPLPEPPNG